MSLARFDFPEDSLESLELAQVTNENDIFFSWEPNSPDGRKFTITYAITAQAGRDNEVYAWGYNVAPNGLQIDATEPSISHRIESFFTSGGNDYMEAHLQIFDAANSVQLRPFGLFYDRTAHTTDTSISGHVVSMSRSDGDPFISCGQAASSITHKVNNHIFNTGAGVQLAKFINGALVAYMPVYQAVNGDYALWQTNAAASDNIGVIGVDGLDRVILGSNVVFGAASGAAGSRIIGRGEHTSAPAGTLTTGQWELSVYDNGAAPVLRVRYNDGGVTKTGDVALV